MIQMDQNARKVRNQDINPCIEESDDSQKCLNAYNYDKSMCSTYFQRYKNCRKYWFVSVLSWAPALQKAGVSVQTPPLLQAVISRPLVT
uniref:Coiled-coil-helix-coiled-coil-helix domain-containing protein 7 n=1 Tax=Astatotilapia calliptera TaxID=8154 RepID=A0AAX7T3U7_ASTCA